MEFLAGLGALFLFGSLWFWIAVCVLSVAIIFFDEQDCPFWAGAALIGFFLVMRSSGLLGDGLGAISAVVTIVLYIVLGVGWSVCKWWFHALRCRDNLAASRKAFVTGAAVKDMNISPNIEDPMPAEVRKDFRNYLSRSGYWNDRWADDTVQETASLIPSAADNKSKIIRWMSFWPWSAAWTLLNDPLRRLFNRIFVYMKKTYQRMAEKVFGNVSDEM